MTCQAEDLIVCLNSSGGAANDDNFCYDRDRARETERKGVEMREWAVMWIRNHVMIKLLLGILLTMRGGVQEEEEDDNDNNNNADNSEAFNWHETDPIKLRQKEFPLDSHVTWRRRWA